MFKKLLCGIGHESIQVRTQTTKIISIRLIPASGPLQGTGGARRFQHLMSGKPPRVRLLGGGGNHRN